jgi:hypothetical protein
MFFISGVAVASDRPISLNKYNKNPTRAQTITINYDEFKDVTIAKAGTFTDKSFFSSNWSEWQLKGAAFGVKPSAVDDYLLSISLTTYYHHNMYKNFKVAYMKGRVEVDVNQIHRNRASPCKRDGCNRVEQLTLYLTSGQLFEAAHNEIDMELQVSAKGSADNLKLTLPSSYVKAFLDKIVLTK